MHRFDRMEIEEIVREITCGVRNAYPETVMGKVMEENRNMAREWKNMKMEIEQLRQQADTHRENLKAQREENEALRRKIDSLQSKPKIRSGNRRDDVSIEDVNRDINERRDAVYGGKDQENLCPYDRNGFLHLVLPSGGDARL